MKDFLIICNPNYISKISSKFLRKTTAILIILNVEIRKYPVVTLGLYFGNVLGKFKLIHQHTMQRD